MYEQYISPFEEVEKGIRSCDLPSSHLYWDNHVKVRMCFDIIRESEKINLTRHNPCLFQREFSKNTTVKAIEIKLQKKTTQVYGAVSSLKYTMTRPSGVELRLIND